MNTCGRVCTHVIGFAIIAGAIAYLALPKRKKEELCDKVKTIKKKELKMLDDLS